MKSLDHTTERLTFWENQAAALIANATPPATGRLHLILSDAELALTDSAHVLPSTQAIITVTPRMKTYGLTAAQWRTIEAALIKALREGKLT
jgi:hypothetical protein